MSPRTDRVAAADKASADQLARTFATLLLPHVTRRVLRKAPGARHVRVVVRRIPQLRPRQPRSVAIASALLSAYLRAATAARHHDLLAHPDPPQGGRSASWIRLRAPLRLAPAGLREDLVSV